MSDAVIGTYAGVMAPSPEHIWQEHVPVDNEDDRKPFLSIVLPCGESRVYQAREDLPNVSVECECGRLPYRHFFVLYEDRINVLPFVPRNDAAIDVEIQDQDRAREMDSLADAELDRLDTDRVVDGAIGELDEEGPTARGIPEAPAYVVSSFRESVPIGRPPDRTVWRVVTRLGDQEYGLEMAVLDTDRAMAGDMLDDQAQALLIAAISKDLVAAGGPALAEAMAP